jgi:hypothetical protein
MRDLYGERTARTVRPNTSAPIIIIRIRLLIPKKWDKMPDLDSLLPKSQRPRSHCELANRNEDGRKGNTPPQYWLYLAL